MYTDFFHLARIKWVYLQLFFAEVHILLEQIYVFVIVRQSPRRLDNVYYAYRYIIFEFVDEL